MTARCPNRQRRHTPSSWTTPNPDTTLLGLYFQQPARAGEIIAPAAVSVASPLVPLAVGGEAWSAEMRMVPAHLSRLGDLRGLAHGKPETRLLLVAHERQI